MNSETEKSYRILLIEIMDYICAQSERRRLHPQIERVDDIFRIYKKYEAIIQKEMKEKDIIMEHHKIAAALCCSVLKAKPINQILDNSGIDLKLEEKHANEMCAYLFGMQVIQNFWVSKIDENISDEEKKIYNNKIIPPQPNNDNTTYPDWFIKLVNKKAFSHFDCENRPLFEKTIVLFIAHIFFGIESYSYQYFKK